MAGDDRSWQARMFGKKPSQDAPQSPPETPQRAETGEGVGNPLLERSYRPWGRFQASGDMLMLVRKGGGAKAIKFVHVIEAEAESGQLVLVTCSHAVISLTGRNLWELPFLFRERKVEFVQEFDESRHTMPPGSAPVIAKIETHGRE